VVFLVLLWTFSAADGFQLKENTFLTNPNATSNLNQTPSVDRIRFRQSAFGGKDTIKMIPDKWFALDKVYHFLVSFSLVGSGYHLLANRIGMKESYATSASIGGTLALGISKEIFDNSRPDDRFSYRDLIYDILGITIGYFVFIH